MRWLRISLEEGILSSISEVTKELGKELLTVILFGSYVYNKQKAKDIDIIVIVDHLKDIHDKVNAEVEITKKLIRLFKRSLDVLVFDLDTFKENLVVGTVLTGLVLGYNVLYDKIGVEKLIHNFIEEISKEDEYVLIKKRKYDFARLAKMKLKRRK